MLLERRGSQKIENQACSSKSLCQNPLNQCQIKSLSGKRKEHHLASMQSTDSKVTRFATS